MSEKTDRRGYVKYAGAGIVVIAVAGAGAYYASRPAPSPTVAPTQTQTVERTITQTAASPTEAAKDFSGISLKFLSHSSPWHARSLYLWRKEWTNRTGGKVDVIECSVDEIYEKAMTEAMTGEGVYDLAMASHTWTGTFDPYIEDVWQYLEPDIEKEKTKGTDPVYGVGWNDILPIVKDEYNTWGKAPNEPEGKKHKSMYMDFSTHLYYYRTDLFNDEQNRADFKAKYKYEMPNPAKTWEEYNDISEFFTGWDWDNDGKDEFGTSELGKRGRSYFWALQRMLPKSYLPGGPDKYRGVFYFDPETMEPLINQPGCVRGLELWAEVFNYAPPGSLTYEFVETGNALHQGDVAQEIEWLEMGQWANMSTGANIRTQIRGKLGYAIPPGSREVWDREKGEWRDMGDVNYKPINAWGAWVTYIFKTSKNKEAAYDYAKWTQSPAHSLILVMCPDVGQNPWRISHFTNRDAWKAPEVLGDKNAKYGEPGYIGDDASLEGFLMKPQYIDGDQMLDAIWDVGHAGYVALRIPGAAEYEDALDIAGQKAISGEMKPQAALDECYDEWDRITNRLDRDKQLEAYLVYLGMK
ncbi:ABC transporter substrate-binding protein [[Eubacterium] cellulosolvens]